MPAPTTITATYRIVTPMFIGDAEQKASEVTPASIKGALRFWWRALNWGRIRNNCDSDVEALQKLHAEEATLFGSSKDEKQSLFLLRLTNHTNKATLNKLQGGVKYLLGQGLYHFKNGLLRNAIQGKIAIECTLKSSIEGNQINQLSNAMLALGMLGGLGARARKGFGSLAIQALSCPDKTVSVPQDKETYKAILQEWNKYFSPINLPPFSAFSKQSRIDFSATDSDTMSLLEYVGSEQQLYRSWGRNGQVGNKLAEQNFKDDHDNMKRVAHGTAPDTLPKRAVFGLPHNYFFSSDNKKVDIAPSKDKQTRRASPLFIHIHQFPDNTYALIQSLLPATFLPNGRQIEFNKAQKDFFLAFDDNQLDWQVIHNYLDRFPNKETLI